MTIIARDAKRHTYTSTHARTRTRAHTHTHEARFSTEVVPVENDDRKKEREGTVKSRAREARESSGKPATALDGRRDHILTSTPTFREPPPPGTYLTFLVTGSST